MFEYLQSAGNNVYIKKMSAIGTGNTIVWNGPDFFVHLTKPLAFFSLIPIKISFTFVFIFYYLI
jgi:hypothetical protein